MTNQEIVKYGINALLKAGLQKAQCKLVRSEKKELNLENNDISLLRTVFDNQLILMGIHDHRKGELTINKLDPAAIDQAAREVMELADSSQPDEANDISPEQPRQDFAKGPQQYNLESMIEKLKAFLAYRQSNYPKTIIEGGAVEHDLNQLFFLNSNGAAYSSEQGNYNFDFMCTSKDGRKTSSFDYTGFSTHELNQPLDQCGAVELMLKNSANSIKSNHFPGKIVGDVIILPQALGAFISFIEGSIGDYGLISGKSIYKDKLNQSIASPLLTIHSRPTDPNMPGGYFVTKDGFAAEDCTFVEKGILKSFQLGLLGANKTGKKLSKNRSGSLVLEPGSDTLEEMIRSVSKGLLLGRFSGGRPSDNGDFSGVAKNSFYIEDGEIKHALTETMISGNIAEMLLNIEKISKKRIDFGSEVAPWVQVTGINISGG